MTNGISPTVRIWNNLKLTVQSSYNKMIEYDKYLQTHQRDIGVDEIQNFIRVLQGDLNNVQNQLPSLNTPTMTQPNNIQSESKEYKNIKLSEKQLHRVVKESVERVLKEDFDTVSKKVINYIKDNYRDRPRQQEYFINMYNKIKNGYYDDVLNSSDREYWIYNNFPIFNHVCEIDKDFAFRYGDYDLDIDEIDRFSLYDKRLSDGESANWNVNDETQNGKESLHDYYWKEHEGWFNNNDKLKKHRTEKLKNYLDKTWQDTKDTEKWSKIADSRPLHRKGSLNRD